MLEMEKLILFKYRTNQKCIWDHDPLTSKSIVQHDANFRIKSTKARRCMWKHPTTKGSLNFAETGIWLLAGKGRVSLRPPLLLFLLQTVHNPSKQRLIAPKGNRGQYWKGDDSFKRDYQTIKRISTPCFLFLFSFFLSNSSSFLFTPSHITFFRFLSPFLSRAYISFLYPSRSHSYAFFFFLPSKLFSASDSI